MYYIYSMLKGKCECILIDMREEGWGREGVLEFGDNVEWLVH